jgi:zinc and cadmium transporter
MSLLEAIFMFISVLGAGLLFFLFRKSNPVYLKLSLAFTGAYLFAISMTHLMPGVFHSGTANIGYFILAGFFIQLILEYISEGIEHGHIHVHKHQHPTFPLTMMLGLCIHSFLEGMPLSGHFYENGHDHDHGHYSLLTGIILHHLPVAFALTSMLIQSGVTRMAAVVYLSIFAAMAPAGAAFSSMLSMTEMMNISNYFNQIMGVVIGIFLHISTTILFESGSEHRFNLYKLLVILAGAGVALLW